MARFHGGNAPGRTLTLVFPLLFVPLALFCQDVRIAQLSLGRIGESRISYPALAATVARFDVVAADDVEDAGCMEKVLAGMDGDWEALVSGGRARLGFFYNDRIQLVKELGAYPKRGQSARPSYGLQFRLTGSRFAFNLVACHVSAGKDQCGAESEMLHLSEVYRYFEKLTGNRGITILAGNFSDEHTNALEAAGEKELISVKGEGSGTAGSAGCLLGSAALHPRIKESGIGRATPFPAYIVLKTGK